MLIHNKMKHKKKNHLRNISKIKGKKKQCRMKQRENTKGDMKSNELDEQAQLTISLMIC